MLKRFFSLSLILCLFSVNSFAASDGLKSAFDELHYALTVEWDQQDQKFYDVQMSTFISSVKELQSQDLSRKELVEFVKQSVKEERLAHELDRVFATIQVERLSEDESMRLAQSAMKNSYQRGASWSGSAVALSSVVTILVLGASVALAGYIYSNNHGDCRYLSGSGCF